MKLTQEKILAIRELAERGTSSGLDDVEWLKPGTAVIAIHGHRYVLKRPVPPVSTKGRIRKTLLGTVSLEHERRVNDKLNQLEYHQFRYPLMVRGSGEFLLFEYIDGEHRMELGLTQVRNLVKALTEFQFRTGRIRPTIKWRLIKQRSGRFRQRRAAEHTGDTSLARVAEKALDEIQRQVTPLPRPVVMHGDLHFRNVLFRGDNPYVIDFSTTRLSDRWIWNDVVWFSLPASKFFVNTVLLQAYASEVRELCGFTAEDLVRRLRYSMINRVVFLLGYADMSASGTMYREFFYDVLAFDGTFENWVGEVLPGLR